MSFGLSVAAMVFALGGCGKKMSSEEYVENAQRFYEQKDYEKARVEYRNALAVDAESAIAHRGLATIAKFKEDYPAQFFHLQKAVGLNANDAPSLFELGELALLLGELEVAQQADKSLAALESTSALHYQLAIAIAIAEKNWSKAETLSAEALVAHPDNAQLWGLTGVAAKKQLRWDEALAALDKAISLSGSDSAQYRLLRIEVSEARGDVAASIDDLTALIASAKNPEAQIIRLTQLINQHKGQAQAISELAQFIAQYPEAYALQTLHVDLIKQIDAAHAGQLLADYITAAKSPVGLLFYRAYAALANDHVALAEQDLQTILSLVASDKNLANANKAQTEASALLAEMAWLKGDVENARTTVKTVLDVNPSHVRTLLLQAKIAFFDRRDDDAVASLNKVLSQQNQNLEALGLLAIYYQQQDRVSIASDLYDRILQLDDRNYEALQFKIEVAFNQGFLTSADTLLTKAINFYPQDATLLSIKVQVAALRGRYTEADASVEKLIQLHVDNADILFFKGYIQQKKNDDKAAAEFFKQAINVRGRFDKALDALYQSAQKLKNVDDLQRYLTAYVNSQPDDLNAQLLLAQLHANTSPHKAITQIESLLVKFPQWHAGTLLLANILVQQQRIEDALALLKNSYHNFHEVAVGIAYSRQLETQQLNADAAIIYDDLLQRDSSSLIVRNNYALLLAAQGEPAGVLKALQLSESFASSDNPALLDTYGSVLLQAGKANEAIYIFKKALDLADIPDIHLHYANALQQAGKFEQAQAALQRLQNKVGDDPSINAKIAALKKRWQTSALPGA
ncbi:MAG: tetratricopeptide repeat protein [Marinagarivorans sp.]|nr:tetratricopeptide repeat protein [Marinagarivorans sp.]